MPCDMSGFGPPREAMARPLEPLTFAAGQRGSKRGDHFRLVHSPAHPSHLEGHLPASSLRRGPLLYHYV